MAVVKKEVSKAYKKVVKILQITCDSNTNQVNKFIKIINKDKHNF